MREIKFRAFDKTCGDMEMDVQNVGANRLLGTSACETFEEVLESWEFEVMQFTGLKDKNGVEIYEGDVCLTRYYSPMWKENLELIQVVEWNENETSFGLRQKDMKNIEVIGNTYEHPHLLKGGPE